MRQTENMRVMQVHLADGYKGGGGGIAMLRLHLGLREAGVDSHILCRTKTRDSPDVTQIAYWPRVEYRLKRVTRSLGLHDIHLVSSFNVKRERAYKDADVIDFQGIHTQTLSYLSLPSLTKHKPGIFTMHDMWALTGHCTYSYDCERWKIGCGKCPYPETHPAIERDNTRIEWKMKRWAYRHSNLVFCVPSTWLVELAKQSMVSQFPIYHIPYGVDTQIYRPMDRQECRAELGIPARGARARGARAGAPRAHKVIMFAALKLDNYRKGGDLLVEALQGLPASLKAETTLLTIGQGSEAIGEAVGMETCHLGYVDEERRKAVAYNAADLFLCPTRADNLPLVLLESMACGTPMVSFAVGGVPDLVRPGITGFLAEPESAADFRSGIVQLLEDDQQVEQMKERARAIALKEYRRELQIERTIAMYSQLLDGHGDPTSRAEHRRAPMEPRRTSGGNTTTATERCV